MRDGIQSRFGSGCSRHGARHQPRRRKRVIRRTRMGRILICSSPSVPLDDGSTAASAVDVVAAALSAAVVAALVVFATGSTTSIEQVVAPRMMVVTAWVHSGHSARSEISLMTMEGFSRRRRLTGKIGKAFGALSRDGRTFTGAVEHGADSFPTATTTTAGGNLGDGLVKDFRVVPKSASKSIHQVADVRGNAASKSSPLSMTMEELTEVMGGKGRAQAVWDCLRDGVDPVRYYCDGDDGLDIDPEKGERESGAARSDTKRGKQSQQQQQQQQQRRLGSEALRRLRKSFGGYVQDTVARVVHTTVAADGTTKLLLRLTNDGMEVETVIIPWDDRNKSTLCVSSQVGCKQACTFCMTGKMGKLRSLSADEILVQVFAARAVCGTREMYPVDNVVFMGMGEPADNADAVVRAATVLTDRRQFQLAPRRVTISTVGPDPASFEILGEGCRAVLAWSVHAARDEVRRKLVPTTRHTMNELRGGLIRALLKRSRRLRATMLEVTLLDGINDTVLDAEHLADFCQPVLDQVPGIKLVVNLIPWNDIDASNGPASAYKTPTLDRVLSFQNALVKRNILCYIRTTRGDDKSAACGQLATKRKREKATIESNLIP